MAKDESRRDRWVKASQRLRNAFQMAAVSCYMMVLFAQPAAAADTMWTRFSTIIAAAVTATMVEMPTSSP